MLTQPARPKCKACTGGRWAAPYTDSFCGRGREKSVTNKLNTNE